VKAHARVAVDEGTPVLRCEPPLALRTTRDGVFLVGTAASPVGGDDVSLDVDIDGRARCTIRSSAATVALPGPRGEESRWTVHARVGGRARLDWRPEPLVAAARCRHVAASYIEVSADALITWREELVLGRAGEEPGWCMTRLHVDRDGVPLVRHDLVVDAQTRTTGVLGNARVVGTLLSIGARVPGCTPPVRPAGCELEVFALDHDVALVTALGPSAVWVRAALDTYVSDGAR
jgi:urease accessory protein